MSEVHKSKESNRLNLASQKPLQERLILVGDSLFEEPFIHGVFYVTESPSKENTVTSPRYVLKVLCYDKILDAKTYYELTDVQEEILRIAGVVRKKK